MQHSATTLLASFDSFIEEGKLASAMAAIGPGERGERQGFVGYH